MSKHPMQPIEKVDNVFRFKQNALVRFLVDVVGLNNLATSCNSATDDDWNQLAQLIGYSVSGFGDLSYASPETVAAADAIVEQMMEGSNDQ